MKFNINKIDAVKTPAKLTKRDKKLIQLLIQNGRTSISELATKIKISKPAITQKIKSLKEKGILLEPILYSSVKPKIAENPLYIVQISTDPGYDTNTNTKNLLSIPEINGVLWYNGTFNLVLGVFHKDTQRTIEKIEEIIRIKKIRIMRAIDNWYHAPHIFDVISDKKINKITTNTQSDKIDKKILKVLYDNPRAPIIEISEKIKSAPITIKKRISQMQKCGAIVGISNYVNYWLCGKDMISINLIVKGRENLNKIISKLLTFPQTSNVWELDHEWNLNVILLTSHSKEIKNIIKKLHEGSNGILDYEISTLVSMSGK